ncbi:glycosyltransferase family 9 protein [Vibrio sp. Of14-4]|uniref:glycosyltransferase family 9 protein n=1 Tax=Vibrio sp. Of14-4 TaxID=2724878 RepID=UPI001EF24B4A|nr:glycosyltransferase family 9 protein [Vibrio sp. Of14-4]MCG7489662.1 glycosyltransferase family 9 protein [Vibrio sp. Of14-4]
MTRILISGYTGLGNFILKTPVIKALKVYFPNSDIDIIAGNGYGTEFVLDNSNLVNKIYLLKESSSIIEKLKFFYKIRKNSYDVLLLPFDSNKRFLFFGSYLSGIKQRLIHVNVQSLKKIFFFSMMPNNLLVPLLPGRHEIDLNFDLLEALVDGPIIRNKTTFISIENDITLLDRFKLTPHDYVVLQIGAANGSVSAKKWPASNFVSLIEKLSFRFPQLKIVTVGDTGDYENDIKPILELGLPIVNTAGHTSIGEVASLLSYSRLVIAHDSGIMHMANALSCTLIALYGPTDFTRTRPLGTNSTVLYSKTECFCKMYNFKGNEQELQKLYPGCMDGITVDGVFEEVKRILHGE